MAHSVRNSELNEWAQSPFANSADFLDAIQDPRHGNSEPYDAAVNAKMERSFEAGISLGANIGSGDSSVASVTFDGENMKGRSEISGRVTLSGGPEDIDEEYAKAFGPDSVKPKAKAGQQRAEEASIEENGGLTRLTIQK